MKRKTSTLMVASLNFWGFALIFRGTRLENGVVRVFLTAAAIEATRALLPRASDSPDPAGISHALLKNSPISFTYNGNRTRSACRQLLRRTLTGATPLHAVGYRLKQTARATRHDRQC